MADVVVAVDAVDVVVAVDVAAEAAVAAVAAAAGAFFGVAAAVTEAAACRGAAAVIVESMQFLAHWRKKEGAVGGSTNYPANCLRTVPLRLVRSTDPRPASRRTRSIFASTRFVPHAPEAVTLWVRIAASGRPLTANGESPGRQQERIDVAVDASRLLGVADPE